LAVKKRKTDIKEKNIEKNYASYAIYEKMKSTFMSSLRDAVKKHNLKNGLYYVVITDLSSSTNASDKISNELEYCKWVNGFIEITKKALDFTHRNDATWGLKCGDASLFLFTNFEDVIEWRDNFLSLSDKYNDKCKSGKINLPEYHNKIIVHLGEIDFGKEDEDLKLSAVNVIFEIEKKFEKNDFGITDTVREAILPEISSGRFGVKKGKKFNIDKKSSVIQLWKLIIN